MYLNVAIYITASSGGSDRSEEIPDTSERMDMPRPMQLFAHQPSEDPAVNLSRLEIPLPTGEENPNPFLTDENPTKLPSLGDAGLMVFSSQSPILGK